MILKAQRQIDSPAQDWFTALSAAPHNAVAEFMAGHVRMPPYHGLSARSLALALFEPLAEDHPARLAFDKGLWAWLEERRQAGVMAASGLAFERDIAVASEAFDLVGLLELPKCAVDFRVRYLLWNSWSERLTATQQRDGRFAFWRALALTQRAVAKASPSLNAFALEPHWLGLCEGAGRRYSADFLAIGLLGLQLLPNRGDVPEVIPWMTGLARWADSQNPPVAEFKKQWWALRVLYPRIKTLREVLPELLEKLKENAPREAICDFWLGDVGHKSNKPDTLPQKYYPRYPDPREIEELIEQFAQPFDTLKPKIERRIAARRKHAEETGIDGFIVKSACNIGMELLRRDEALAERGAMAESLAREALVWQPNNHFAWALWCEALRAQGHLDAAEDLRWETIRRYPDNPKWRTQLALFLSRLPGRAAEAEAVLAETIRRFPDNVVARTQLAEMLIDGDRLDEARAVVRNLEAAGLMNEVAYDLKARLLFHGGDRDAAIDALEQGRNHHPDNSVLAMHLGHLSQGKPIALHSKASQDYQATSAARTKGSDLPHFILGRLRKAAEAGSSEAAREMVKAALAQDPNIAYARYLDNPSNTQNLFAARFIAAIKAKDPAALDAFSEGPSTDEALIDFARAYLFKDEGAAARCLAWREDANLGESHSAQALKSFLKLRLGSKIAEAQTGADFIALIADNDNFREDLIESALAGLDLAVAA